MFAAALAAATPVFAQDAVDADQGADPRDAVTGFMQAFDAQDADAMRGFVVEGATVTVIEEREGDDRSRTLALDDLITSIAASPADLEEPVWAPTGERSGRSPVGASRIGDG